jgi:hypothetical protein
MQAQWEDERTRLPDLEAELPAVTFDAVWHGLP